jgi:hypothetical protein
VNDINWTTVIVAALASLPSAIVAWKTHKAVNSRMDRMLELAETIRKNAANTAAKVGGRRHDDP